MLLVATIGTTVQVLIEANMPLGLRIQQTGQDSLFHPSMAYKQVHQATQLMMHIPARLLVVPAARKLATAGMVHLALGLLGPTKC